MVDLPPVIGDPAGMRALATTLRSAADSLGAADSSIWSKASSLAFAGPAASRLSGAMSGWHGDVSGAATALSGTADLLERSATEVETAQRERERRLRGLADGSSPRALPTGGGRYGPEDRVPGKDIDEWPPAVIDTGKPDYTLHPAEPSDNRGMGAYIGNKLRGVPDGTPVRIGHDK